LKKQQFPCKLKDLDNRWSLPAGWQAKGSGHGDTTTDKKKANELAINNDASDGKISFDKSISSATTTTIHHDNIDSKSLE